MKRLVFGVALVFTSIGLAACGSGGNASSSPLRGLPTFVPSSVISKTPGHEQLTSPEGLRKVATFYANALIRRGWTIASTDTSGYNGVLTARRGYEEATITISTTGRKGTSISFGIHLH